MEDDYKRALWIDFPYGNYAWMHDREQGEPFNDKSRVWIDGANVTFSRKGLRVTVREPQVYVPEDIFENSGIGLHLEKRAIAIADEILEPVENWLEGTIRDLAKERRVGSHLGIHQYKSWMSSPKHVYGVEMLTDLRKDDEGLDVVNPVGIVSHFQDLPDGIMHKKFDWLRELAAYMEPDEHKQKAEFKAYDLGEALDAAISFFEKTPQIRKAGLDLQLRE